MGTTQIQNIDILFGTIIIFGFIILFAMAFGFVWLQDRIYDECQEMRKEIRENNNKEPRNKEQSICRESGDKERNKRN